MSASAPFEVGGFYQHRNMRDACFRVRAYHWIKGNSLAVKAEWWNIRGYPMGVTEELRIYDIENYRRVYFGDSPVRDSISETMGAAQV